MKTELETLPHDEIMRCTRSELKGLFDHIRVSVMYLEEINAPERAKNVVKGALESIEEEWGKLKHEPNLHSLS